MNTKNKLMFCGNSSIDYIITDQGEKNVIGGSAINAAISAVLANKNNETSIVSSVGCDFPLNILNNLNIDTQYIFKSEQETNSFIIDEINNTIHLKNTSYLPIVIPNNIRTNHLHVSCRKGVPFIDAINKIDAQHYSLDIMWSSVKDFIPQLSACLKKADFLFCNDGEFRILTQNGVTNLFPENLTVFITNRKGVYCQKGIQQKYFETIQVRDSVSTVGAGDTFLGGFLGLFNGNNLNDAIQQALAMASISIKDFGNIHLANKSAEINQAKKIIQHWDKNNETKFDIYNRSILQR